jgi:large subunit ribosomal protein L4
MNTKVYDIEGKEKGTVRLNDSVFNIKPNKSAIYYALRAELANQRQGTASTKGRAEVRGGGAKPYRQKGTGRARAGTRRSPIWTGGGTTFGPKPRSYRVNLPKKMKRLSIRSLLSMKTGEQLLKVVEDFSIDSGKTKDFQKIAMSLVDEKNRSMVLFIDNDRDPLTRRAGRNIPWIHYFAANLLNTKDLYYATQLILTKSAVKLLNEKYAENSKG